MKTLKFLSSLLVAALAGAMLSSISHSAHAQITSPSYVCQTGNGGQNSGYPCAQYLVEVVPQRLGGGIFIYQIQDNAIDIRTLNAPLVTSGSINGGASVQVFQSNSSVSTVTIAAGAP